MERLTGHRYSLSSPGIILISPLRGEPLCQGEGNTGLTSHSQANKQATLSSTEKLEHEYERVGS